MQSISGTGGDLRQIPLLEVRADHDVWDELARIVAPTLVIGGRYDELAAPQNSENLAARIPDSRLVLCDGGHVFFLQDPTAWPTIVRFLRRRHA